MDGAHQNEKLHPIIFDPIWSKLKDLQVELQNALDELVKQKETKPPEDNISYFIPTEITDSAFVEQTQEFDKEENTLPLRLHLFKTLRGLNSDSKS